MKSTLVMVVAVLLAGCGPAMQSSGRGSGPDAAAGSAVIATVRLPDFGVDVATGADGRAYVAVPGNKLVIVDPNAAAVAATVEVDGEPYAVAVTPDARRAYLVDLRGEEVSVVDTAAAKQTSRIPMGTMQRPSLRPTAAASRDGTRVYVANTARDHLFVIDTRADEIAHDLFLDFHPADVAVSADGHFAYVVGCRLVCTDGTLIILDTDTYQEVRRMMLPFVPTAMAVTPDGRRAYVADGREAQVSVVDLVGQKLLMTIPVGPEPVGIAMNATGTAVYVTSFRNGTLAVISTGTNDVVGTTPVGGSPRAVVVSRDGTRAFVTHSTSTLSIVDLARLGR